MATLKLNPAIAKDIGGGNIQCIVCSTQIKSKVWISHVNSKKHRDSIVALKQKVAAPAPKQAPSKRSLPQQGGGPVVKKQVRFQDEDADERAETDTADDENQESATIALPTSSQTNDGRLAWQRVQDEEKEREIPADPLAQLPMGFFDDAKRNEKTGENIARQKQLDAEYAKFLNEVALDEVADEDKAKEIDDLEARDRELEQIDETMAGWIRINELEKKKDAIRSTVGAKNPSGDAARRLEEMEDDQEGDDDDMLSDLIDGSNWRTKGF